MEKETKKTFRIVTLGCKVNQYESAYLTEALVSSGWSPAAEDRRGDVTVVNTCIVTQRAAHQSRQEIRKAARESGKVVVTGCYAQAFPEEIARIDGVSLVVGNASKRDLPRLVSHPVDATEKGIFVEAFRHRLPFEILPLAAFPERTRAYLKIQDGCESFCSYCIVPYSRGPLRSLPPREVLAQLERFCEKGYKEIVLTGIHLGKYGVDLGRGASLATLLSAIGGEGFPLRIRLSSLEPNELDDALIELSATERWFCRHFHIPLQSGDDRILGKMNRHYTNRDFRRLIEIIHERSPLACIGADVLAGFPGEDEQAHCNTLSLINDLPVSYLHVFPFSPRPGTPAAKFKGRVNPDDLKRRAAELREIGRVKRYEFYRSCLKQKFDVLPETSQDEAGGMMKGFSDNYLLIGFPFSGPPENDFIPVRVERVDENAVIGSRIFPS